MSGTMSLATSSSAVGTPRGVSLRLCDRQNLVPAAARQMLWTTRRARPFPGMLLLVIELTRAEIHGHVVRWPRARKP
jgi:hypothetical protein